MIIQRIEGATRVLGAPQDATSEEVKGLPIRDIETNLGRFMVSAWTPTPDELLALQRGETVKLWIRGVAHPVVAVTVGPVDDLV